VNAPRVPSNDRSFSSDRPIESGDDDRYTRFPFAQGIARVLRDLPNRECFVVGLQGPWGDGKTSVLRLIDKELSAAQETVTPVWFNPWRIGGIESITIEFFHTLASASKTKLSKKGEEVVEAISKYVPLLRPLSKIAAFASNHFVPGISTVLDGDAVMDEAAEWAKQFKEPTVEELRRRLRDALLALPHKIVVFIDDIDRLPSDEIATVFRLVKACADFPNVVYVLAYDREVVTRSLGARFAEGSPEDGAKYIEKIVQIPVSLPPASRRDLDQAVMKGLAEIEKSNPWISLRAQSSDEQLRWRYAYWDCVARRLTTPRHVAKYLNAVRFAAPFLQDEANPVDMLLVEALRVCFPQAYDVVKQHQHVFIGEPRGEIERRGDWNPQQDLLAVIKGSLSAIEAKALDRMIETLFPRYNFSKQGMKFGSDVFRQWEKHRRVCSPAYGHRYFCLAIGSSDIADREVDRLIADAVSRDVNQTIQDLRRLAEPLRQTALLSKLHDRKEQMHAHAAETIAVGLASMSDDFEEPFSLFSVGMPGLGFADLAFSLMQRLPDHATRAITALRIIEESETDWFAAKFMSTAHRACKGALSPTFVDAPDQDKIHNAFVRRYDQMRNHSIRFCDLEKKWKFDMLQTVARAGARDKVSQRLLAPMHENGQAAVDVLRSAAQPISRSGETIPSSNPSDLSIDDLTKLSVILDVHALHLVSNKWVSSDAQTPVEKRLAPLSEIDQWLTTFIRLYSEWVNSSPPSQPSDD
jgi:predicted KAP-like P-loop ATPase